jgi:RNA polymerase sigma-70 factor, ECF subfamily
LCAGKTVAEASDVLQQSFLQAIEKCDHLKEIDKFKSWFFKIITRCYLDTYRKNFWRKFQSLDKIDSVSNIPDVFNYEKYNEDKMMLMNALSQISDKERSALLLFEIAGFSIEEIAQIQNENSISTIKSRLSRSRQKLKEIILKFEKSVNDRNVNVPNVELDDVETETLKVISIINPDKNGR